MCIKAFLLQEEWFAWEDFMLHRLSQWEASSLGENPLTVESFKWSSAAYWNTRFCRNWGHVSGWVIPAMTEHVFITLRVRFFSVNWCLWRAVETRCYWNSELGHSLVGYYCHYPALPCPTLPPTQTSLSGMCRVAWADPNTTSAVVAVI